eukprot:2955272-Rhodomonas_salina.1
MDLRGTWEGAGREEERKALSLASDPASRQHSWSQRGERPRRFTGNRSVDGKLKTDAKNLRGGSAAHW